MKVERRLHGRAPLLKKEKRKREGERFKGRGRYKERDRVIVR